MAIEDDILALCNTIDGKVDAIKAVVDAIKLKTDNLPSDPADESLLEAAITAATTGAWDELLADHLVADSFGEFVTNVKGQYGIP